jgi:ferric-dicitrate binding protein FerR (iron transport regulator)
MNPQPISDPIDEQAARWTSLLDGGIVTAADRLALAAAEIDAPHREPDAMRAGLVDEVLNPVEPKESIKRGIALRHHHV